MEEYCIIESEKLKSLSKDNVVNLTLHTLELNKQVLVFNNSKRSSEATAERISKAIKNPDKKEELEKLSDKILKAMPNPTRQCRRLADIVKKGIAFHHSGLVAKQRTLIEKAFKDGLVKVISSTPTLAAGLNLPAYKVIIKDYKRYSQRGFADIPILEYHQMSGRAGRPGRETTGKAVLCVKSEDEIERVTGKYIFGKAEELISKLAVEPTLKMYMLSMIAMDMTNTKDEVKDFFSNTFYAHQYRDLETLNLNLFRIINILKDYNFVNQDDDYYMATAVGKKVSELYLNPDTAHYFLENLGKFIKKFSSYKVTKYDLFSLIYFVVNTMEMKPLFRVSKLEEDKYVKRAEEMGDYLLIGFDPFEMDYEHFLNLLKTTDVMMDWIQEAPEDYISEKYKITPGELNFKLETVDWLLYCLEEFSTMKKSFYFKNFINKLRVRFKNGIKEELIPFVSLKGVGRVRARKLYHSGLKKLSDLKSAEFATLSRIVGDSMAIKIKEQLTDGSQIVERPLDNKPKEIKVREVSDDEVDLLVDNYNKFEKEKEEKNMNLTDWF